MTASRDELVGSLARAVVAAPLGAGVQALERISSAADDAVRIARFLRGRATFGARETDVWVATYPRSGTTLVQWMLVLLANGGEPPHDSRHLAEASPWFERDLATGKRAPADLAALTAPRIFKTHLTSDWVPRGARVVAVTRDGADVAASYFHLYRDYLGFEGDFDAFFERFVRGRVQYGSWCDHVAGYRARAARDGRTLVLDYAEIVADRERAVRRIAAHAGLAATPKITRRVAELASLEAMKAREAYFDHATALLLERGVTPRSFVRSGRVGDGRSQLDDDQRRRLDAREKSARPRRTQNLRPFLE